MKKFLKFTGILILIILLLNLSTYVFNHVSPWLGIALSTITIIATICLIIAQWGKWCLDKEGKKTTDGN